MNNYKVLSILLLAMSLWFTGTIAYAETDELNTAADQYNKNKSNDKYKVVCRKEAPIGSRIKQKVCRTVAMSVNSQRQIQQHMSRLRTSVSRD